MELGIGEGISMLVDTGKLLNDAQEGQYAIGAFNVYNLEGVLAVINAATADRSPIILQIHPNALDHGGVHLVRLCLAAGEEASVPVSVHLDHCSSPEVMKKVVMTGVRSIMVDGSHMDTDENETFTREIGLQPFMKGVFVEAELGRISGIEDGLTIEKRKERLTDPSRAAEFVRQTKIGALAICIGNVHGSYSGVPDLDFNRLTKIRSKVHIPLVLHGTSGLPEELIRTSIELGVSKFNVNTELRQAYLRALSSEFNTSKHNDLLDIMGAAIGVMEAVIRGKLQLFGSVGRV